MYIAALRSAALGYPLEFVGQVGGEVVDPRRTHGRPVLRRVVGGGRAPHPHRHQLAARMHPRHKLRRHDGGVALEVDPVQPVLDAVARRLPRRLGRLRVLDQERVVLRHLSLRLARDGTRRADPRDLLSTDPRVVRHDLRRRVDELLVDQGHVARVGRIRILRLELGEAARVPARLLERLQGLREERHALLAVRRVEPRPDVDATQLVVAERGGRRRHKLSVLGLVEPGRFGVGTPLCGRAL
mmetsp:Transcript_11593/g.27237  ORF Transcript_11593/g.27237 Transcript_11593/m.27237 type:complete len:242 (+) Transcript_11593:89-814(+)|eukprot:scaffold12896_cov59-Phaeocystis_antarctica.AAC.2